MPGAHVEQAAHTRFVVGVHAVDSYWLPGVHAAVQLEHTLLVDPVQPPLRYVSAPHTVHEVHDVFAVPLQPPVAYESDGHAVHALHTELVVPVHPLLRYNPVPHTVHGEHTRSTVAVQAPVSY